MMDILLLAGTTYIQYSDLADLIANSICQANPPVAKVRRDLNLAVKSGVLRLRSSFSNAPVDKDPPAGIRDSSVVWPDELQRFLDESGMKIKVLTWNQIELK